MASELAKTQILQLLQAADVEDLLSLQRTDVLSLHLDTDPTKPENQRTEPAYRIWARHALHALVDRQPKEERRGVAELVERVEARLREERPRGRGLGVYAANGVWKEVVLPVPLENRLSYGLVDVWPLLWAREIYVPYAVLLVHRDHARLLVTHLGEAAVVEDEEFHLDTRQWRFTAGKPPSFAKGMGMSSSRGSQRDVYDARVDDQVRKFWAQVAAAAARALEELGVHRLILGGPEEGTAAIRDLLPEPARRYVAGSVAVPATEDWHRIRDQVLAVAREDRRRRQEEIVQALLGNRGPGGSVLDLESSLQTLSRRQVLAVAADRDVQGPVWVCRVCELATSRSLERCPTCGGPLVRADVTQVLPILAHRNRADLHLLPDGTLRPYGGVGVLLRFA